MTRPGGPTAPTPTHPPTPAVPGPAKGAEARQLEAAFLAGLDDAQNAYERIVETQAWIELGYETYADWWSIRVVPVMRALSMRPTKEIAAAGIAQVREEEAVLPPSQRRTQRELGEMFGIDRRTASGWKPQDRSGVQDVPTADLEVEPGSAPAATSLPRRETGRPGSVIEDDGQLARAEVAEAMDRYLPPDEPWRGWRAGFMDNIQAGYRVISRQTVDEVAERADDELVSELYRLAAEITRYADQVRRARLARYGDNVVPMRSVR